MTPMKPFQIIPVVDILGGEVVRAIKGVRSDYKAISSQIVSSPDPFHVVERFIELFDPQHIYIADLNAIMGEGDNENIINELVERFDCGFMIDAGYKKRFDDTQEHPRVTQVIATETFAEWENCKPLLNVAVSIDTKEGSLVSPVSGMTVAKVLGFARSAGAKRFIHLRIDAVGTGAFSRSGFIEPEQGEQWFAGGGVGSTEDLLKLADMGYAGALVSTALHEKKIP